ncbi:MAG: MgtC/SapB family protein [Chloroflexi bacterium]|nr:MgtC/SapB family protein [Chloroflexota bacterium]
MEALEIGTQVELTMRLVAALVLGAVIGWERELQRMPAGFRTHALVSLGSAIFTVISAYGLTAPGSDPTRIAAQIVSGIGFLGGGAILHYGGTVRGLTTAASLWAVAAVGMAAGAGLLVVASVSTVLVIVALEVFQRLERVAKRRLNIPTGNRSEPIDDKSQEEGD